MAQKTQKRMLTKPLSVRLTDEEVLKYGRDAARAMADGLSIEKQFESVKKDYKARLDEQASIVSKLSPRIHSGIETRDVECEEIKNWTKGTVVVTRLDTGEIVESRPMREDEKHMEMTFEDDKKETLTPEELASPAGKAIQFIKKIEAKRRVVVEDETGTIAVAENGGLEFIPAEEPAVEAEEEDNTGDTSSNPFA